MIKHEIYWPSGPVVMGLKSPLDQFTPFIGVDRVIRAGGRIKDARVGYNQRHPVLLPRNDEDVRSYINHVHANNLHCGLEATLNATRQRVWILQGRAQIKVQLNKCVICQRRRKMPTPQLMGSIPEHRLKTIPPFTSTLCDLMGPFAVTRSGRKGSKAYVVVFTCGTYHAVSFEIIFSLTADEFIMALIRFNSRYPFGLKTLISDHGTNFIKANTILKEAMDEFKRIDLTNATFNGSELVGIQWLFGVPKTGWTTGKVERCVGMAKQLLFTMLSRETLEVEIFRTTLSQIELILNNRPVTKVSDDHNDYKALRPVDFLLSAPEEEPSMNIIPPGEVNLKERWTQVRELSDTFARRWKKEYLSSLIPRSKWKTAKPNLEPGNLVICADEKLHRDSWRLGRVQEVKAPNSVQVRRIMVRFPDGKVLERHHNSLVKLELD